MRARDRLCADHPIERGLAFVGVVLRVDVVERDQQLRMRRNDVEGLDERVEADLPVAFQVLDDVQVRRAPSTRPPRPVLAEVAEIILQRCSSVIHADEHPAVPAGDPSLGQAVVRSVDVPEVPGARDLGELTVEVPGEAVERTPQLCYASPLIPEESSPVQARVVECADAVGPGAHDDERGVRDLVDDAVADRGDLFFPAGDLPHPFPHLLDLAVVPFARDITLDTEGLVAKLGERGRAQLPGHGARFLVDQRLDAPLRHLNRPRGDVRGGRQAWRPTIGPCAQAALLSGHRATLKPAASASHVCAVMPRSRSRCFCTRSVGVRGRSSRYSMYLGTT